MTISDPFRAFVEKLPHRWRLLPFESMLAEPVRNGIYKTKEFHGRGARVVNMGELFRFDFISDQEMKRVELTADEERKSGLNDGDLLFARRSLVLEGAGKCSLVVKPPETTTFESSIIRARPNRRVAEPLFLFYLFHAPLGRAIVASIATRTAVSGIRGSDLSQVGLPVPPLSVQRRIMGILSAYDELMKNCQRRIRILEEMARTLYSEWFVQFRFPGHKNLPRVDSPLGPIPKGWEAKKLGDLADVNRAQINARTAPAELSYIDISSVSPGQIDTFTNYTFAEAPGRARRVVQHGDTLWSCVRPNRRSHSLFIRPGANTIASTGFAVLTPTRVPFTFLYFATTTDDFVAYLTNNATGAAYPAVTATTFEKADLITPTAQLLKRFGDATIPMAEQIDTLRRKIQNLRHTRDLLLPRLLSGQVSLDVSAVEDVAGPAAPAPPFSQTDRASEEPALRAAEKAPPYRVKRAGHALPPSAEPAEKAPVPIDQIDRTEVLQVIRQMFSDGPPRGRSAAIRDVARELGYRRTGPRIQEILHTDLMTAVRRCILANQNGTLRLRTRSIADYDRDFLKQQFLAAIGRTWIDRETAIRDFCRWLGFARTGPVIQDATRSLINGLLREQRLESDGAQMVRRR